MTLQLVCKSYSTFVILFHSIQWLEKPLQAKGQRKNENSKGEGKGEGGSGNGKQGEGRRGKVREAEGRRGKEGEEGESRTKWGENYEERKGNEELGQCKWGKRKKGGGGKYW